eukprot:g12537.t1 g12537   contig6:2115019-2116266(+)
MGTCCGACCQGYATLCRMFTYVFIVSAVVLSCLALSSCEFLTSEGSGVGIIRFERDGADECSLYGQFGYDDFGWLHMWSRVTGFLAPIFGFILLILMSADCCCKVCCSKLFQTFLVIWAQICQAMTFVIYASNACTRDCKIGDGSIVSWTAWFLYFIGGFFLCCSPKHDPICCQDDKDDEPKVVEQPAPVATSPPMVNEDVEIGAEDPPEGSTTKLQDPPDGSTTKPQVY